MIGRNRARTRHIKIILASDLLFLNFYEEDPALYPSCQVAEVHDEVSPCITLGKVQHGEGREHGACFVCTFRLLLSQAKEDRSPCKRVGAP